MIRHKRGIAMILLLGAVVNVVVAWGCCLLSTTEISHLPPDSRFDHPTFGEPTAIIRFVGRGITSTRVDYGELMPFTAETTIWHDRHGLPFRSMAGGYVCRAQGGSLVTAIELPFEIRRPSPYYIVPEYVPLRPLFPGFLVNTAFYAALLWPLIAGPFALRRMRRRRDGLCAACAYPIGGSPVCSECGGKVTPRESPDRRNGNG